MPRSANQKLKLLCLCRILWERTDEDHPLTVPELIQALEAWDIKAERKSIYDDLEVVNRNKQQWLVKTCIQWTDCIRCYKLLNNRPYT